MTGIDANTSTIGIDVHSHFIGSSNFYHRAGELQYKNSILSGDIDGDGDFLIHVKGLKEADIML